MPAVVSEADLKAIEANVAVTAAPPKPALEYVTIPERDEVMDWPHPVVGLNGDSWGPGTHLVKPEIAEHIRQTCERYRKAQMRILQPKPKQKMNGSNPMISVHYADDGSPAVKA
jgi:hypothetical protein